MTQIITWEKGEKRNTEILNRHFEKLLPKGIYEGFAVTDNASLFLNIEKGIILTGGGVKIEEDADLPTIVTIDTGDALVRVDLVVLQHVYSPANNPAVYVVIKGTPGAGAPPLPADPPVGSVFTQLLATITVPALAVSIGAGDITLEALTSISLTTVPFSTLSDISSAEADAFNAMNDPSAGNPVATIKDTNANFLKPTPESTPSTKLAIKGGRLWDARMITSSAIVDSTFDFVGLVVSADSRIDVVHIDPATGTIAKTTGAEAASPTPPAIIAGLIPIAHVLIDETVTVVIDETDVTDVRPLPSNRTPELFDLPGMTSDIKDAITGAAAPAAANVFVTTNALTASGFVFARTRMDIGVTISDEVRLASGALVTCHDAGFSALRTVRTTGTLIADITGGNAPGGLESTLVFAQNAFYHIYLIAVSTDPAPDFSAALVISTSPTAPNLTGAAFTTPGYDIFRRLGAVRAKVASDQWIESFNEGMYTRYRSHQILVPRQAGNVVPLDFSALGTGSLGNPFSATSRVPTTALRASFICFMAEGGDGVHEYFAVHPSLTSGTTGGVEIGAVNTSDTAGVAESSVNEFELDLDSGSTFRMRRATTGSELDAFELDVSGYYEQP